MVFSSARTSSLPPPKSHWLEQAEDLELGCGEVHVWRFSIGAAPDTVAALTRHLTADELERANRYRFERNRNQSLVCRGVLRIILGFYLEEDPAVLQFRYGPWGKPELACSPSGLRLSFNLSRSQDLALVVIAQDRDVGVDIELDREVTDAERIVEGLFSEREKREFRRLRPEKRRRGFLNCWTRKEALIKASGEGLSMPLESFSVSLAPDHPAALLEYECESADDSPWSLRELDPGPGYVAAVAARGHDWRVRCWDYERLLPVDGNAASTPK